MVDTRNPYAAPQADEILSETLTELQFEDATQRKRVANFVLDTVFRQMAAAFAAIIALQLHSSSAVMVVTVVMVLGYYVFFEALTGRTPAKYITGTRVVDMTGGKPTFGQILGRSAARFIPFEPLSFFGSSHRGWHDSLSRTRVISIGPDLTDD